MGFILKPEEGDLVWALGAYVAGKATGDNTGGAFELIEHTGPRGYASPLHTHINEAEAFYVVEGEVTFVIGEDEMSGGSGYFAYVPAKEQHAFRVDSPTAKFLMLVTPPRLMPFFDEIGEPALSPTLPPPPEGEPDLDALVAAATRHGMEVLGPPPGAE